MLAHKLRTIAGKIETGQDVRDDISTLHRAADVLVCIAGIADEVHAIDAREPPDESKSEQSSAGAMIG